MNTKPCGDIPSASSLEYGEIAVNYASGKEAVMLRNTEDAVVTHVGKVYPGSLSGEVFNDYTSNIASGDYSHAEGNSTSAIGQYAHAEGFKSVASGIAAHAEGYATSATSIQSHAEGNRTIANNNYEHACGRYNKSVMSTASSRQTRFSVGIGTSDTARRNAIEAKSNGDVYIYGVGGFDGQNDADADVLPIGEAIPSIVVTSALPSTLASDTIYFIY